MHLNSLTAISPIDGRYRSKTEKLSDCFSEYALIKDRVFVEIRYFLALADQGIGELNKLSPKDRNDISAIAESFSEEDAQRIKEIESVTNHDVKAVEYLIKEKMDALGLQEHKEWVHFGLTSQDINNTAAPLGFKRALEGHLIPKLEALVQQLATYADQWMEIPMLARTHGQPASPTRLGKEILVFSERLKVQIEGLKAIPHCGKFGGATGNMNAHHVAFPDVDWYAFADQFIENHLGLKRSHPTTQIEHYDQLAAQCDAIKRINTILIDLARDCWTYISMDYFKQKTVANEVGSSAMPHKVNPIDFENAEGNFGLANALLEHLASKLPVSRLQRDLTDSTVMRNLGMPVAHTYLALQSLDKGLGKLMVNEAKINADLEANWAVLAEAIQTILRREAYSNAYEALKTLTRGKDGISKESISAFIETLDVDESVKAEMRALTPQNYTGIKP